NASEDKTVLENKEANKLFRSGNAFVKTKPIKTILEDMEMKLIEEAMLISKGNVKRAAEYLEIPRQTLQQKLKKYKRP
ncbi:MAG: helix-turn-helix domain-containing protein, partial [Sedimentibacter sp.]